MSETFGQVLGPPSLEPGQPVDAGHVAGLRRSIQHLVSLDGLRGSDDIAGLALRIFRAAHQTLSAGSHVPSVESDFKAVTAELGEVAGWLLYDADRQDAARAVNLEALQLSRLAGHREMELFVLSSMAMQVHHVGRGRESLRISGSAMDGPRLPPRVETLFRLRHARSLASLGDRSGAEAEMGRARAASDHSIRATDPGWTWWVNRREITWHEAMMYADFEEWPAAVERFERAADLVEGPYRRGSYNHNAHLLDGLVRVRDWRRAEEVAAEVLPLAGEVSSGRVTALIRRTLAHVRGTSAPSTVADLVAAIEHRATARAADPVGGRS